VQLSSIVDSWKANPAVSNLDPVRNATDVATSAILQLVEGKQGGEAVESEVSNVRPFRNGAQYLARQIEL